jgi:hypothetical protein
MNLPPIVTHRSVALSELLACAGFNEAQCADFYTSLADTGDCSWGDNRASLVETEFLAAFIKDSMDEDTIDIPVKKLENLGELLEELGNLLVCVDLEN